MKIELKHLAPYLPYELQLYGASDVWVMHSLGVEEICIANGLHTQTLSFDDCITDYSPMLRPISSLTKEIEHKGEKFVPIIEIAKLYASTDNIEAIKGAVTNFHYFKCYYGKSDYQILIINDNLRGWFSYYFNDDEPNCGINIVNEWEVRDKLFEWHFDVFGLIKVGLAIDINTLSE